MLFIEVKNNNHVDIFGKKGNKDLNFNKNSSILVN